MDIKKSDHLYPCGGARKLYQSRGGSGFFPSPRFPSRSNSWKTSWTPQLFERINRTVSLTEKGRQALGYAHQIIRLSQGMEDSVHHLPGGRGPPSAWPWRIPSAIPCWPAVFPEFQMQYPGVFLKINHGGNRGNVPPHRPQRSRRHIDVGHPHLQYILRDCAREARWAPHFIAGRRTVRSGTGSAISPQELTQQPFLLTERGMSYRRLMEERLAGMSLEIRPCLEIGSADLICQLVSQGEALGFLPDYVTARARAAGQIRWLPVEGLEIRLWKQLLYHKDKWVSPPIQAVLDFCVQREFAEDSPASCQSLSCSAGISRMNASSSREAPFTPTTAEDT